jgi:N-methylhydantoinase A
MLSGGGIIAPDTAAEFPVRLVESGPAGGILAGAYIARQAGFEDLIVLDIGGTTAKAGSVRDGQPLITSEYEVDRVHRFKKGSGTPLAVPTIDIIEIGAGGGSIASINALGLLQIGPQSAGSRPGPICYGRGGAEPTVTDADLLLGYLDAKYFVGGTMRLDVDAASAGIDRVIGQRLGFTTLQAAWAIHEIVNENMASAIRMYVAEKGGDLGKSIVVACGGAGPVHAHDFARRLGVSRLLIPRGAGVFSALGFLVAPVSYELARTTVRNLNELTREDIDALYTALEREVAAVVRKAAPHSAISFQRAADLSYIGQGSTVRVKLGNVRDADAMRTLFYEEYRRRYGHAYDDVGVQLVTPRVNAIAKTAVPTVALPFPVGAGGLGSARKGRRLAYEPKCAAMVPHEVYAMDAIPAGSRIEGPAIIEEASSTFVMGPNAVAEADARGFLLVDLGSSV